MTVVAIVDDHRLFTTALTIALETRGFDVFEPPLRTLEETRAVLVARRPHALLLDLDLGPLGDGSDLVAPVAASGTAVLVLTASYDEAAVGRCLELGAVGWLPKYAPFEELCSAVAAAVAGGSVIATSVRRRIIRAWHERQASASEGARLDRLTPSEASVLGQLMEGCSVEEIAALRVVSEATVRSQVKSILVKLGVHSQLQAVAVATRAAWRPPAASTWRSGGGGPRRAALAVAPTWVVTRGDLAERGSEDDPDREETRSDDDDDQ